MTVEPCLVEEVNVSPSEIEYVEYTIGDPEKYFGPYLFTQVPSCGYDTFVIEFEGLPDFIVNVESGAGIGDFMINQIFDGEEASYTIKVNYILERFVSPINLWQTLTTTHTATFIVNVSPACTITEITGPTQIDDVTYTLGQDGFKIDVKFETDSPCDDYPVTYSMKGGPSNLAYNSEDGVLTMT